MGSRRQAFDACEAHVKGWAPTYVHHTQLVEELAGVSTFRTVWSKPTKQKPISDMIAEVFVTVDLTGDAPAVSHRVAGGFASFAEPLAKQERQIDRHIDDKRAVRAVLARLNTTDRLPKPPPYIPGSAARGGETAGAESAARAKPDAGAAQVLTETDAQLEALLIKLFRDADTDNSGSLDLNEFYSLFETASLGLSRSDVTFLLAAADASGDGVVQYAEFAPIAVDVIQSLRLRSRAAGEIASAEEAAMDEAMT